MSPEYPIVELSVMSPEYTNIRPEYTRIYGAPQSARSRIGKACLSCPDARPAPVVNLPISRAFLSGDRVEKPCLSMKKIHDRTNSAMTAVAGSLS